MPNTKSAERRMRSDARKYLRNQSVKSRVRTLERNYLAAVAAGKKEEAAAALSTVTSAFDKAAKSGVVHKSAARRKKSRLALRLNRLDAAATS